MGKPTQEVIERTAQTVAKAIAPLGAPRFLTHWEAYNWAKDYLSDHRTVAGYLAWCRSAATTADLDLDMAIFECTLDAWADPQGALIALVEAVGDVS